MSKSEVKPYTEFILPSSIVSRTDVSRLVGEAERLDSELTATRVRKKVAGASSSAPVMSKQLAEFLEKNHIEVTQSKTRSQLIKQLRILKDKVPVIHMTFAVQADPESLQHIAAWLRDSIHPQAVVDVGLQPALVAGVYLRTANHVQDLSLRGKLNDSRHLLEKELEAFRVAK